MFDRKLKRKDIADKLYDYRNSKTYINDFINIVEETFSKHVFESDSNFIFGGRKKHLYNEFFDYLDNSEKYNLDNPLQFAIGNLEEFICNDNYGTFSEDVDTDKWIDNKTIMEKI